MKRIVIARTLLLILLTQFIFACTENSVTDPAEDLLNNLSRRLEQKDYVSSSEFGKSNPYEEIGTKLEVVYHNLLKYPLAEDHGFIYGNVLVSSDKAKHKHVKEITRIELEKAGITYSEEFIDQTAEKLSGYAFTSEDMTRYFQDAEESQTLTPLEHKIFMLQMRAISVSKTNSRLQDILRTVEFEVIQSGIETSSKNKILLVNAVVRNLVNIPSISMNGAVPNFFSGHFQQTTPVVVGTFLVLFAVVTLITAFTSPTCYAACQNQMVGNAFIYASAGLLVCYEFECLPCVYPCTRNNVTGGCNCP